MAQIKAVVFDYGSVISTEQVRSEVEAMLDLIQVEESQFYHWYYHYRPSYDLGSTGEEYWQKVLTACGVEYTPELAAKLITHDVKSWTQLNPAVLEWAAALKDDGYQLGIISNMVREVLDFMQANFDWLEQDLFNSQIYSCHWRVTKPDPRIYRISLKQLGLEPEDCLFIDDLEVNIEAAQKLGFAVFHYQGPTALENLQSYFASRTD
ncbi:MAG TPA: HAD family phosphatase [Hydrogenispora sp.]|nr:HAD family phosphatase [Hydrogenispora sp.]